MIWKTSRRDLSFERTLVMGILNVTPDSFYDGGEYQSVEEALKQAERLVSEGADIIDIGGESTRPNSERVSIGDEIERVVPVIEAVAKRFDVPISVDTTKSEVAKIAIEAGAEIINDISGLRFDDKVAGIAAGSNAGLVLMHSRGSFETMHKQEPVEDIVSEVSSGLRVSLGKAIDSGVAPENIALDIGIGFSKTFDQNLELLAKLDKLVLEFQQFPVLVGTSRKSFIGKILGGAPADERLVGSLATVAIAAWNGVNIVRTHDVKETLETIKIVQSVKAKEYV